LRIVSESSPARYQYGTDRAHTAGRCPPAYTPLPEGTPAEAAAEPWTESDRDGWADACARDAIRENGGGW
jgi:hypothetical protein